MIRKAAGTRARSLAGAAMAAALLGTCSIPATPAQAASTCQNHNADNVNIGVCANQFSTSSVKPDIYLNHAGTTSECSIEIDLWSDNGYGKLSDKVSHGCTTKHQEDDTYTCDPEHGCSEKVHADACLRTRDGGFRVGRSDSVPLTCYPS